MKAATPYGAAPGDLPAVSKEAAWLTPAPLPPDTGPADAGPAEPAAAATADTPGTAAAATRFRPRGQQALAPSGAKARVRANLEAIATLKRLQSEGRATATPDEQALLARYGSWGAVAKIFDDMDATYAAERAQLAELLTEDEWHAAVATTRNAHFTDLAYAAPMWQAIGRLGFTEGRGLEPGCGAGNFLALAPDGVAMTGVERDPITAAIAGYLHPHADIRAESLIGARIPDGYFDAAIGNVPFDDTVFTDPVHNRQRLALHNHAIVWALHKVRPGGLVMVLTSRYTMDGTGPARAEIAARADLVGAVRLPEVAHRKAAGTDVVTDLLVLRRRLPGQTESLGHPFLDLTDVAVRDEEGELKATRINQYFADNPAMVLGEHALGRGQYRPDDYTVIAESGQDIGAALGDALAAMCGQAETMALTLSAPDPAQRAAVDAKAARMRRAEDMFPGRVREFEGSIIDNGNGTFLALRGGEITDHACPKSQAAELSALLGIRDTYRGLLAAERSADSTDDQLADLRAELGRRYDAYVRRHGFINRVNINKAGNKSRPPMGGFRADPYAAGVLALEYFDPDTGTATKSDIFTRRAYTARTERTSADSPADAVAICLNEYNEIRLGRIAELLGLESDVAARDALGDLVFDDPVTGEVVHAPKYLSGDVRTKLEQAEAAHVGIGGYTDNIAALRKALPPDKKPGDINARFGDPWIGPKHVEAFLRDLLNDRRIRVFRTIGVNWKIEAARDVKLSEANRKLFGTGRRTALEIAERMLRGQSLIVRSSAPSSEGGRMETPQEAKRRKARDAEDTESAQAKADEINRRFVSWLWQDGERADQLVRDYNRVFNSEVRRNYDGSHLTFPGLIDTFIPHEHQRSAIYRALSEGEGVLFDHGVGLGKTFEINATAMEMRRLGICNKPAIMVPNNRVEGHRNDFLHQFPNARVLTITEDDYQDSDKDRRAEKRRQAVARIANGDWDAVIFSYSFFAMMPMSAQAQNEYIRAQTADMRKAIAAAAADGDRRTVKQAQGDLDKLTQSLQRQLQKVSAVGICIEDTGIDHALVDEVHNFLNLFTPTNNSELSLPPAQRASMLDMWLTYLRQQHGERIATFATGTPFPNSMTQSYVMFRLLRPATLRRMGLYEFDAYRAQFLDTVINAEVTTTGDVRIKERIGEFRNEEQFTQMWNIMADVKIKGEVPLGEPPLIGDAPRVITVPQGEQDRAFNRSLVKRAAAIEVRAVEPEEDNHLKLSHDGLMYALHPRLAGWPDPPTGTSKIEVAAAEIVDILNQYADVTYVDAATGQPSPIPGANVVVFADHGTPNPEARKAGRFIVYDFLAEVLAERGIPRDQTAFIQDFKPGRQTEQFIKAFNAGKYRVVVGHSKTLGEGLNLQNRAVATIHLDGAWNAKTIQQRNGRVPRQGNQNTGGVIEVRTVLKGSMDAYQWQLYEGKARWQLQARTGRKQSGPVFSDLEKDYLTATEMKALASDNPLIMKKAEIDRTVRQLETAEQQWQANRVHRQYLVDTAARKIDAAAAKVDRAREALDARTDTRGEAFAMRMADGRTFAKRADAAAALQARLGRLRASAATQTLNDTTVPIGELGGLHITATVYSLRGGVTFTIAGLVETRFLLTEDDITDIVRSDKPPFGLIQRLENQIATLDGVHDEAIHALDKLKGDIERAKAELDEPFARADELAKARTEQAYLEAELTKNADIDLADVDNPADPAQAAASDGEPDADLVSEATVTTPQPAARQPAQHTGGVSGDGPAAPARRDPDWDVAWNYADSYQFPDAEAFADYFVRHHGNRPGSLPSQVYHEEWLPDQPDDHPVKRRAETRANTQAGPAEGPSTAGTDGQDSAQPSPAPSAPPFQPDHHAQLARLREVALADPKLAQAATANSDEDSFGVVFDKWLEDRVVAFAVETADTDPAAGPDPFVKAFIDDPAFRGQVTGRLRGEVYRAYRSARPPSSAPEYLPPAAVASAQQQRRAADHLLTAPPTKEAAMTGDDVRRLAAEHGLVTDGSRYAGPEILVRRPDLQGPLAVRYRERDGRIITGGFSRVKSPGCGRALRPGQVAAYLAEYAADPGARPEDLYRRMQVRLWRDHPAAYPDPAQINDVVFYDPDKAIEAAGRAARQSGASRYVHPDGETWVESDTPPAGQGCLQVAPEGIWTLHSSDHATDLPGPPEPRQLGHLLLTGPHPDITDYARLLHLQITIDTPAGAPGAQTLVRITSTEPARDVTLLDYDRATGEYTAARGAPIAASDVPDYLALAAADPEDHEAIYRRITGARAADGDRSGPAAADRAAGNARSGEPAQAGTGEQTQDASRRADELAVLFGPYTGAAELEAGRFASDRAWVGVYEAAITDKPAVALRDYLDGPYEGMQGAVFAADRADRAADPADTLERWQTVIDRAQQLGDDAHQPGEVTLRRAARRLAEAAQRHRARMGAAGHDLAGMLAEAAGLRLGADPYVDREHTNPLVRAHADPLGLSPNPYRDHDEWQAGWEAAFRTYRDWPPSQNSVATRRPLPPHTGPLWADMQLKQALPDPGRDLGQAIAEWDQAIIHAAHAAVAATDPAERTRLGEFARAAHRHTARLSAHRDRAALEAAPYDSAQAFAATLAHLHNLAGEWDTAWQQILAEAGRGQPDPLYDAKSAQSNLRHAVTEALRSGGTDHAAMYRAAAAALADHAHRLTLNLPADAGDTTAHTALQDLVATAHRHAAATDLTMDQHVIAGIPSAIDAARAAAAATGTPTAAEPAGQEPAGESAGTAAPTGTADTAQASAAGQAEPPATQDALFAPGAPGDDAAVETAPPTGDRGAKADQPAAAPDQPAANPADGAGRILVGVVTGGGPPHWTDLSAELGQAGNLEEVRDHLQTAIEHAESGDPGATEESPRAAEQPAPTPEPADSTGIAGADHEPAPPPEPAAAAARPPRPTTSPDTYPPYQAATTAAAAARDHGATLYVYRAGSRCAITAAEPLGRPGYLSVTPDGQWNEHWRGHTDTPEGNPAAPRPEYPLTLTEARDLAAEFRLRVRITQVAGTPYVALTEPTADTPVISFAADSREVFTGRGYATPAAAIGYLARYRRSIDELSVERLGTDIFTAGAKIPGWGDRVAELAPHIPGQHDEDRKVREAVITAAGHAARGQNQQADQALRHAEDIAPPLVPAPERAATILRTIENIAPRYQELTGDGARYVAETLNGTRREWTWIADYVRDNRHLLDRTQPTQDQAAARDRTEQDEAEQHGRRAYDQAKPAHDAGDHQAALALIDEAELYGHSTPDRLESIRKIISEAMSAADSAAPPHPQPSSPPAPQPAPHPDTRTQAPAHPAPAAAAAETSGPARTPHTRPAAPSAPSAPSARPPEVNKRRRGHAFYPPRRAASKIPALYATDKIPAADTTIHLHYFCGAGDWYIAELNPDGMAYGYARLAGDPQNAEWGYIYLPELEDLAIDGHLSVVGRQVRITTPVIVERDLHWTPAPARDCIDDYREPAAAGALEAPATEAAPDPPAAEKRLTAPAAADQDIPPAAADTTAARRLDSPPALPAPAADPAADRATSAAGGVVGFGGIEEVCEHWWRLADPAGPLAERQREPLRLRAADRRALSLSKRGGLVIRLLSRSRAEICHAATGMALAPPGTAHGAFTHSQVTLSVWGGGKAARQLADRLETRLLDAGGNPFDWAAADPAAAAEQWRSHAGETLPEAIWRVTGEWDAENGKDTTAARDHARNPVEAYRPPAGEGRVYGDEVRPGDMIAVTSEEAGLREPESARVVEVSEPSPGRFHLHLDDGQVVEATRTTLLERGDDSVAVDKGGTRIGEHVPRAALAPGDRVRLPGPPAGDYSAYGYGPGRTAPFEATIGAGYRGEAWARLVDVTVLGQPGGPVQVFDARPEHLHRLPLPRRVLRLDTPPDPPADLSDLARLGRAYAMPVDGLPGLDTLPDPADLAAHRADMAACDDAELDAAAARVRAVLDAITDRLAADRTGAVAEPVTWSADDEQQLRARLAALANLRDARGLPVPADDFVAGLNLAWRCSDPALEPGPPTPGSDAPALGAYLYSRARADLAAEPEWRRHWTDLADHFGRAVTDRALPVGDSPQHEFMRRTVIVAGHDWGELDQQIRGNRWAVANAPRPLSGEVAWTGPFRHGVHYAAGPLERFATKWRRLGAVLLVEATPQQIVQMLRDRAADHGYHLAELAAETPDLIESLASELALPWEHAWLQLTQQRPAAPTTVPAAAQTAEGQAPRPHTAAKPPASRDAPSPAQETPMTPVQDTFPGMTTSEFQTPLPPGTQPVAEHTGWGGRLRPERLLYADGTALLVHGQGPDHDETWRAVAAGSIGSVAPADANAGDAPGRLQVVRWDHDRDQIAIVRPAQAHPAGVDPYAGLSDRDRARWEAFDFFEHRDGTVAYLPAVLIEVGDRVLLEASEPDEDGGKPKVVTKPHEVTAVQGGQRGLRLVMADGPPDQVHTDVHATYQPRTPLGVLIPDDHPTLAAMNAAITAAEEAARPTPAATEPAGAAAPSAGDAPTGETGPPGPGTDAPSTTQPEPAPQPVPQQAPHPAAEPEGTPEQAKRPEGPFSGRIRITQDGADTVVTGTDRDKDPDELRLALRENNFDWHRSPYRRRKGRWVYVGRADERDQAVEAIRSLLADLDQQTAPSFPPTEQQQAIIDACLDGKNVAVQALAGTGKTSTLLRTAQEFAAHSPDTKILYTAFNKSTVQDAKNRFGSNTECLTTHAMARRALSGTSYDAKLAKVGKGIPWRPDKVAEFLKLPERVRAGDADLPAAQIARMAMATVKTYRESADDDLGPQHLPGDLGKTPGKGLAPVVLRHARTIWADLSDPGNADRLGPKNPTSLFFAHDDYLKIWAITHPRFDRDLGKQAVLFDEAQDVNDLMRALILEQPLQTIVVGDSNQSIYSFRGSIDALKDWPADVTLPLTQSFRFGPGIAEFGNQYLRLLRSPYLLQGNPGMDSNLAAISEPDAVLCRSNACAVTEIFAGLDAGKRVALAGDGNEIKDIAEAAKQLMAGRPARHPELAGFTNWREVENYVADSGPDEDRSLRQFVRLVNDNGPDELIAMADRLTKEFDRTNPPQLVVSTAHKAKGREWPRVRIADDFPVPKTDPVTKETRLPDPEEQRLAYVAATRARQALDAGPLTWIYDHAPQPPETGPATIAQERADSPAAPADPPTTGETAAPPPPDPAQTISHAASHGPSDEPPSEHTAHHPTPATPAAEKAPAAQHTGTATEATPETGSPDAPPARQNPRSGQPSGAKPGSDKQRRKRGRAASTQAASETDIYHALNHLAAGRDTKLPRVLEVMDDPQEFARFTDAEWGQSSGRSPGVVSTDPKGLRFADTMTERGVLATHAEIADWIRAHLSPAQRQIIVDADRLRDRYRAAEYGFWLLGETHLCTAARAELLAMIRTTWDAVVPGQPPPTTRAVADRDAAAAARLAELSAVLPDHDIITPTPPAQVRPGDVVRSPHPDAYGYGPALRVAATPRARDDGATVLTGADTEWIYPPEQDELAVITLPGSLAGIVEAPAPPPDHALSLAQRAAVQPGSLTITEGAPAATADPREPLPVSGEDLLRALRYELPGDWSIASLIHGTNFDRTAGTYYLREPTGDADDAAHEAHDTISSPGTAPGVDLQIITHEPGCIPWPQVIAWIGVGLTPQRWQLLMSAQAARTRFNDDVARAGHAAIGEQGLCEAAAAELDAIFTSTLATILDPIARTAAGASPADVSAADTVGDEATALARVAELSAVLPPLDPRADTTRGRAIDPADLRVGDILVYTQAPPQTLGSRARTAPFRIAEPPRRPGDLLPPQIELVGDLIGLPGKAGSSDPADGDAGDEAGRIRWRHRIDAPRGRVYIVPAPGSLRGLAQLPEPEVSKEPGRQEMLPLEPPGEQARPAPRPQATAGPGTSPDHPEPAPSGPSASHSSRTSPAKTPPEPAGGDAAATGQGTGGGLPQEAAPPAGPRAPRKARGNSPAGGERDIHAGLRALGPGRLADLIRALDDPQLLKRWQQYQGASSAAPEGSPPPRFSSWDSDRRGLRFVGYDETAVDGNLEVHVTYRRLRTFINAHVTPATRRILMEADALANRLSEAAATFWLIGEPHLCRAATDEVRQLMTGAWEATATADAAAHAGPTEQESAAWNRIAALAAALPDPDTAAPTKPVTQLNIGDAVRLQNPRFPGPLGATTLLVTHQPHTHPDGSTVLTGTEPARQQIVGTVRWTLPPGPAPDVQLAVLPGSLADLVDAPDPAAPPGWDFQRDRARQETQLTITGRPGLPSAAPAPLAAPRPPLPVTDQQLADALRKPSIEHRVDLIRAMNLDAGTGRFYLREPSDGADDAARLAHDHLDHWRRLDADGFEIVVQPDGTIVPHRVERLEPGMERRKVPWQQLVDWIAHGVTPELWQTLIAAAAAEERFAAPAVKAGYDAAGESDLREAAHREVTAIRNATLDAILDPAARAAPTPAAAADDQHGGTAAAARVADLAAALPPMTAADTHHGRPTSPAALQPDDIVLYPHPAKGFGLFQITGPPRLHDGPPGYVEVDGELLGQGDPDPEAIFRWAIPNHSAGDRAFVVRMPSSLRDLIRPSDPERQPQAQPETASGAPSETSDQQMLPLQLHDTATPNRPTQEDAAAAGDTSAAHPADSDTGSAERTTRELYEHAHTWAKTTVHDDPDAYAAWYVGTFADEGESDWPAHPHAYRQWLGSRADQHADQDTDQPTERPGPDAPATGTAKQADDHPPARNDPALKDAEDTDVNIRYKKATEINGHEVSGDQSDYEVWVQERKGAKWRLAGWVSGPLNSPGARSANPWHALSSDNVDAGWTPYRATRKAAVEEMLDRQRAAAATASGDSGHGQKAIPVLERSAPAGQTGGQPSRTDADADADATAEPRQGQAKGAGPQPRQTPDGVEPAARAADTTASPGPAEHPADRSLLLALDIAEHMALQGVPRDQRTVTWDRGTNHYAVVWDASPDNPRKLVIPDEDGEYPVWIRDGLNGFLPGQRRGETTPAQTAEAFLAWVNGPAGETTPARPISPSEAQQDAASAAASDSTSGNAELQAGTGQNGHDLARVVQPSPEVRRYVASLVERAEHLPGASSGGGPAATGQPRAPQAQAPINTETPMNAPAVPDRPLQHSFEEAIDLLTEYATRTRSGSGQNGRPSSELPGPPRIPDPASRFEELQAAIDERFKTFHAEVHEPHPGHPDAAATPSSDPRQGPPDLSPLAGALGAAKSMASWYADTPEWQRIERVDRAAGALVAAIGQATREYGAEFARDVRARGLLYSVAARASRVIANAAFALAGRLEQAGHRGSRAWRAVWRLHRAAADNADRLMGYLPPGRTLERLDDVKQTLGELAAKLARTAGRRTPSRGAGPAPEPVRDPSRADGGVRVLDEAYKATHAAGIPDDSPAWQRISSLWRQAGPVLQRANQAALRFEVDAETRGLVRAVHTRTVEMISHDARQLMDHLAKAEHVGSRAWNAAAGLRRAANSALDQLHGLRPGGADLAASDAGSAAANRTQPATTTGQAPTVRAHAKAAGGFPTAAGKRVKTNGHRPANVGPSSSTPTVTSPRPRPTHSSTDR